MDIVSYLLGKQAGGGSTPTLQNKSVEITENGTTNVVADSGYDGLSKVEVTTNVSGGGDDEYFNENLAKYYDNQNTNLVSTLVLKKIPNITLSSDTTNLDYAFRYCRQLVSVPLFDTFKITYMRYTFQYCNSLVALPAFNMSNVLGANAMCQYCSKLENVPVFNWKKMNGSGILNMFSGCKLLTDTSIDNILQSCITMTATGGTKTLAYIGFTSTDYPVSRIEALPHYQDFIDAGWTIGY